MSASKKPLVFTILSECRTSKARVAKMELPHAVVDTPVFMPVGTQVNVFLFCDFRHCNKRFSFFIRAL